MVKKILLLIVILIAIISCDLGETNGDDLIGRWICTNYYAFDFTFFEDNTGYENDSIDESFFKWKIINDNSSLYKRIYFQYYTDSTFEEKDIGYRDFFYYFSNDGSTLYMADNATFELFYPYEKRKKLNTYKDNTEDVVPPM